MVSYKKQHSDQRVQALHNLLAKLRAHMDIEAFFSEVLKCVVDGEGALYSCIYTSNEKTKNTQLAAFFLEGLDNEIEIDEHTFFKKEYDFPKADEISLRIVESSCKKLLSRSDVGTFESQINLPLGRVSDNVKGYLQIGYRIQNTPILDDLNISYYKAVVDILNIAFELDSYPIKREYYKELIIAITNIVGKELNSRSLHTDIHCKRVPHIAIEIAKKMELDNSHFGKFSLSEGEWEQFSIAAWLHDCGKIKTPDHILNKRTKLDGVRDRIHEIALRFEVKKQALIIEELASKLDCYVPSDSIAKKITQLENGFEKIKNSNYGHIVIDDEVEKQLRILASETIDVSFDVNRDELRGYNRVSKVTLNLIGSENACENPSSEIKPPKAVQTNELENLLIKNGNLNPRERNVMNEHIVDSIKILKSIPFPEDWIDIAHIAGCHHEKPNGEGYPYGLKNAEIPILSQVISVADVFEALISTSRPYKNTLLLSEVLVLMRKMAMNGDINGGIYNVFICSGLALKLAREFSSDENIDVDDEGLNKYMFSSASKARVS